MSPFARPLLLLAVLLLAACTSAPKDLGEYRPLGEPQTPHRLN